MQLLITFPVKAFAESEEAIFAGGCFWCLEHDLEKLDGVVTAESGYSGGDLTNPTYENHSGCLLYTSPSPRDRTRSRMPSSA